MAKKSAVVKRVRAGRAGVVAAALMSPLVLNMITLRCGIVEPNRWRAS
jgi:hypothetical protein